MEILSFEEFSYRHNNSTPRYNNYFGYFASESGLLGFVYRNKPHFLKFKDDHPYIDKKLYEKISVISHYTSESLIPYDLELYYTYTIMKSYGILNKDLFS